MKKQTFLSVSISFISSFTFLMLTLFIFEGLGWNVICKNPLSIVKTGLVYGVLCIPALFLLNFYLVFKLKGSMANVNQLDMKQMVRILAIKVLLDFTLSSLMIWLSLFIFNKEIVVSGVIANLGIMILTFIFREVSQMVISYHQNKNKIGGFK